MGQLAPFDEKLRGRADSVLPLSGTTTGWGNGPAMHPHSKDQEHPVYY